MIEISGISVSSMSNDSPASRKSPANGETRGVTNKCISHSQLQAPLTGISDPGSARCMGLYRPETLQPSER